MSSRDSNASHSLTQPTTEQTHDLAALLHAHVRPAGETATQHVLEQGSGAGVRGYSRRAPRQPAGGQALMRRPQKHRRDAAPSATSLFPPTGHQFVECGGSRRHQQVKTAALRHTPTRRRRGRAFIRGIAVALEDRNALEPIGEGMSGQQTADAPADDRNHDHLGRNANSGLSGELREWTPSEHHRKCA